MKNRLCLTIFLTLILTLLLSFSSFLLLDADASKKETYYISIVPFHSPEKILSLYQPMIDYLNKHSQYHWKLKLFENHEMVQEGLCSGKTSLAMLGPAMSAIVYKRCNIEPILLVLGLEKKVSFKVIIITANKDIKSVKDLRGRSVGIFKPNTIARAITKKMISDEGVELSTVRFITYARLEDIIKDVITGELDAGGIREAVLLNLKDIKLNVLATSSDNLGFAFFATPGLNQNVKKEFQKIMTTLNVNKNPNTLNITKKWDLEIANGFILPNKDYVEANIKFFETIKDLLN